MYGSMLQGDACLAVAGGTVSRAKSSGEIEKSAVLIGMFVRRSQVRSHEQDQGELYTVCAMLQIYSDPDVYFHPTYWLSGTSPTFLPQ